MAAPPDVPDAMAPAFLLSVKPTPVNPTNVGLTTFTLTFSKAMNCSLHPSITFGKDAPYMTHVVEPWPGWLANGKTWQGRFAIQSDTGDGLNMIRISNVTAEDGFVIPDDTTHAFMINTRRAGAANNGQVTTSAATWLSISWAVTNKPFSDAGIQCPAQCHRRPRILSAHQ